MSTHRIPGPIVPVVALVCSLTPSTLLAYPQSGTYHTVPGSSTSQGPFNAAGVLIVDPYNATATFETGGVVYQGTFLDPSTLHVTGCASLVPTPPLFARSKRADWTFTFDTNASFTWTGTESLFPTTNCSGAHLLVIGYTNVQATLSEPLPGPPPLANGNYQAEPGSFTSDGPFNGNGILTVDNDDLTAVFEIDGVMYSGARVSDTRIDFAGCVILSGNSGSALIDWSFTFDTGSSFAWTGSTSFFSDASCSGGALGVRHYTSVRMVLSSTDVDGPPKSYALSISSYPNPFNPETTLRYMVPSRGRVIVSVYDARGSQVVTLLDEEKGAGAYTKGWRGTDAQGHRVSSGVYFARVTHPSGARTYRMALLK